MTKSPNKSRLFVKGGAQGPGRGPEKGAKNAGRPPEQYVEWLRTLLESEKSRTAVETVLGNADHPAFSKVYAIASDRVYGKPLQEIQNTGDVTIRVVYDG